MGRATVTVALVAAVLVACGPRFPREEDDPVGRAATEIEHATEGLKETSRAYQVTRATYFPELDIAWYDRTAAALEADGYKRFDDIVDVKHNEEHESARSFLRILLSRDGRTQASLFHYLDTSPAARHAPMNGVRVACLETEFSDGSFVVTTNGPRQADFEYGPMIETHFVRTADVLAVRHAHDAHVREYRHVFPKVTPRVLWTMGDIRASQERMQHIKGSYRRELGIPATEDELNNSTDYQFVEWVKLVSDELRSRFPSW